MIMKKILFLIFGLNSLFLISQISFTNVPKDKQLFGRDLQSNYGTILVSGDVNIGSNYNLQYSNWASGEPNNSPPPENHAEIINSNGDWNDANGSTAKRSYVEYDGLIDTLGDLLF